LEVDALPDTAPRADVPFLDLKHPGSEQSEAVPVADAVVLKIVEYDCRLTLCTWRSSRRR